MSFASVSAQQNSALAAANAAASSAATPVAKAANAARTSLGANFNDFLKLLMTQIKNQDPTSPLDTAQFTSQLVQFAGVEQQINANTSLTQLIQLTQSQEVLQSTAIVGKHVVVQSDHLPLQDGGGALSFTVPTARPVAIAIFNDAGQKIRDVMTEAKAGENDWAWDGKNNAGGTMPDGSYRVAVIGANPDGTTTPVPFSVVGTATGVERQGNGVQLQVGALSVDFSAVQSVKD